MKKQIILNGNWTMRRQDQLETIPAKIPGSVYSTLLAAGKMDDPFYRDNEMNALPLMEYDYSFSRPFEIPDELLNVDRLLLRCEGLDTLGTILINGEKVAETNNMHRIWEFDISDTVHSGQNEIEIIFSSPTRFIRKAYEEDPYEGSSDAMRGFVHLRKAEYMFGWDWGPRLPDAGIWRDISLIGIDHARFDNIYVRQEHRDGKVILTFDTELDLVDELPYEILISVETPSGEILTAADSDRIVIDHPELWWPNELGGQPLYRVSAELLYEGKVLDTWQRRIGLRTLTIRREKDQWGESFCHHINGIDIFAKGADYIPEDNILSRITPERTRALLENAVEAHFNTIRVWGGGFYPPESFYETCDELGLLVWQDFMFACGAFRLDEKSEQNMREEFRDNIIRIRNHPSLALWCGNNEIEEFAAKNQWVKTPKQHSEYISLFEYIIPHMVKQYDPQTFYWPSSSSSGGGFDDPQDPSRGDVHYWDVWHGEKPFSDYRKYYFRYVSEFGFQAYPPLQTLHTVTLPEDLNAFSRIMEKHQRNASANGKIMKYIQQTFLYPKDFESLVYTSQLLQAEAIRYGVEYWRSIRNCCMGTIIWSLNDCWPVISWASIDYYGRWKALHYAAKRFFAPVLLNALETGENTIYPDINAERIFPVKNAVIFNVTNDTWEKVDCEIIWSHRSNDSQIRHQGKITVTVPPFTAKQTDEILFPYFSTYEDYISFSLFIEGKEISHSSVLLSAPKHFHFLDPHLTVQAAGEELIVRSEAYAKGVFIDNEKGDLKLEDNWFDMDAGEKRIKVLRGTLSNLNVRSVYNIAY